ncbi:hypothetical protein IE53DRAFT_320891 [Violaceomyces palustris]|uniref:Uncharacterized protein n=1 Tax=Violaceomyces palustris TaxID=1673888 RepID=A0ACD0NP81_9BASI|nr:hypothetical protein IE53DRAFT_320891 [Violaceomyces palustris]
MAPPGVSPPPYQSDSQSVGSPPAPTFSNIAPNEAVFQRLLLVQGTAGDPNLRESSLTVHSDPKSGFQPTVWQVNWGHFKALVPLTPGENRLSFVYSELKAEQPFKEGVCSSQLVIFFKKDETVPPLHLAVLLASDSPAWRDLGKRRELLRSAGLSEVKKRIAIQAYLWQAFHAEQMRRHNLGRRTFPLDDGHTDPDKGDPYSYPRELQDMPVIHLLRSRRTLAEFRDPDNAQQKRGARNGGAMFDFAREALEEDPSVPKKLHHSPVAVLILDTTYDPKIKLVRAHAAIGSGGPGRLSFGVMGSHWIWSAPSDLQGVTDSFLDETRTDENHCVNDLSECPTSWMTLNIGSGAWMHEVGHALNNPHWPSGVMSRGYTELNRAFTTREAPHQRNGFKGLSPIHPSNDDGENHLHRCQAIRARWHPCFRLPTDPRLPFLTATDPRSWKDWNECEPLWVPTPSGCVVKCASGVACIEIEVDGEHRTHIEFTGLDHGHRPRQEVMIDPNYLSGMINLNVMSPGSPKVKLNAVGCNMRQASLEDYKSQALSETLGIQDLVVTKGVFVGQERDQKWMSILPHMRDRGRNVWLKTIVVYSGACFDGLRFVHTDGSSQSFGPLGGSPYEFEIRPDEDDEIERFNVRSGAWIDALEVVMKSGRTTGMRGNLEGGSLRILEAPRGQRILGLFGSSGQWVNSIGLLTT